MAKRFIDSDMFQKRFIRGLPAPYKLLWIYILCECDHSGIWYVDEEVMQVYLGKDCKVKLDEALRLFNEDDLRVLPFDDGKKWFIVPFPNFQYRALSCGNRAHKSVIEKLQEVKEYDLLSIAYNDSDAQIEEILASIIKCKEQEDDPEKTEEKSSSKHRYAPLVLLEENEYEKLKTEYGEDGVKWMIEKLDNYKAARGMTYKSDYRAILSWVVKEYKKELDYARNNKSSDSKDKEFAEHCQRKAFGGDMFQDVW